MGPEGWGSFCGKSILVLFFLIKFLRVIHALYNFDPLCSQGVSVKCVLLMQSKTREENRDKEDLRLNSNQFDLESEWTLVQHFKKKKVGHITLPVLLIPGVQSFCSSQKQHIWTFLHCVCMCHGNIVLCKSQNITFGASSGNSLCVNSKFIKPSLSMTLLSSNVDCCTITKS